MANITITVQSLLNAAEYDSYIIDNGQTINQLKTAIYSATGVETAWFDIVLNEAIATGTSTLSSLGIISGTQLRTHNKISRLTTLQDRQVAKLNLAQLERIELSNPYPTYYIDELPTQYDGNVVVDNPNSGGLVQGRPWATPVVYEDLIFTYGEATISFTLTGGVFSNVTCPYGAGGYSASSGQILMPGNQLNSGTTPDNDILWNYVCAADDGVITGFTYNSGTPPPYTPT
jgi:hypothetical protein